MKKFLTAAALTVAAVTMSATPAFADQTGDFYGSGLGSGPSDAITSAEKVARLYARNTGWLDSECYVRASQARSEMGYYSAIVWLWCHR